MTVKPVDDITKAASGYWNSNPVSASNPGGLDESDDGLTAGHVDNFPAAVGAVGRMAQWVGGVTDTIDAKALALGGVILLNWDSGTSDANPGPGSVRGNHGTLASATLLFVSTSDADGAEITALLQSWDDSSSTDIKGDLTLSVVGAATTRVAMKVTGAVIAASGYVKIPVLVVSVASAPTAGAAVALSFVRAGQKGDAGSVSAVNGKTGPSVTLAPADVGAIGQGVHTIWVPAAAMRPRSTNGAAPGFSETATNKVMLSGLDFDTAAVEYAQCQVAFPKSWNRSTVTAVVYWTALSGSGGVAWSIQGGAVSDGETADAAFGATQAVTDTLIAAGYVHVTATSAAITFAGSPAAGDLTFVQISRAVANGADTLGGDARLLGVQLVYTINAADDA